MTYFQTFKNKLHNLLGVKRQPTVAFKKNRIDFISMTEGVSEKERLIRLPTLKNRLDCNRQRGFVR